MIERVVHKANLSEHNEILQNREYWMSRPPEERIEAVFLYMRMVYGTLPRLQRVGRVIQRPQGKAETESL